MAESQNTDMLVSGAVLRKETVLVRAELKNPSEVTETVFRLRRPLVSPLHMHNLGKGKGKAIPLQV
jgi:hypothetical protein